VARGARVITRGNENDGSRLHPRPISGPRMGIHPGAPPVGTARTPAARWTARPPWLGGGDDRVEVGCSTHASTLHQPAPVTVVRRARGRRSRCSNSWPRPAIAGWPTPGAGTAPSAGRS